MLVSSPFRSRALFYAAVLALLLLIVRVINSTPSEASWFRRNQSPLVAVEPQESEDPFIHPSPVDSLDESPAVKAILEESSVHDASEQVDEDSSASEQSDTESEAKDDVEIHETNDAPLEDPADEELPCRKLPGAEDIVVIMRTGATEIQDKLPAHFQSTFRCYSDLIIFSDYEEIFMGKQVYDVLKNLDQRVKDDIDDFEIYKRVQEGGRAALRPNELSGKLSYEGSKSGKDSPGWRLDKWKFLPMMRETLNLRPDKKFYVFVESDTYIVWSNMLKYLAQLDPSKDILYGSEVQIGDDLFAHGGSAFVMSKSAMIKAAEKYESNLDEYHELTEAHWAGDCVLGIVLQEAGVELGWGWPMFQGGHPEKMDFAEEKGDVRIWCSPILSFHHFNDEELHRIWQLEQDWINVIQRINSPDADSDSDSNSNSDDLSKRWSFWNDHPRDDSVLHGQDVFKALILPNLTDFRQEWNSLSPEWIDKSAGMSLDECRKICEDDGGCRQYTHAKDGCWKGTYPMLGQPWGDVRSGWMLDRVNEWMRDLDESCDGYIVDWTLI